MSQDESQQTEKISHADYLAYFVATTGPVERLRETAENNAAEFAAIGVRYSYILNAGGLVAIPAIMELLPATEIDKSSMLLPPLLFAVGILSAVATNFLAYRSSLRRVETWHHELSARSIGSNKLCRCLTDAEKAEVAEERSNYHLFMKSAARFANCGLAAFVISMCLFLLGIGSAMYGLMDTGAPL